MKKTSHTRLDIPGFSFGQKTGEYIDVARLYGGHGSGRTSGVPHSFQELAAHDAPSSSRLRGIRNARHSVIEYTARKRLRKREANRAISSPVFPCLRRYIEWLGLPVHSCQYTDRPELFDTNADTAYEVRTEFLALVTFTSAREAMIMVRTLAKYGIATEFVQVKIP